MPRTNPSPTLLALAAALAALLACAHRPAAVPPAAAGGVAAAPAVTPTENLERLARLHADRRATAANGEYVLGPGDVISIRAYGLEQMNQRLRVDNDGTITIPLVGAVPVGGRTLGEVQRDLTAR